MPVVQVRNGLAPKPNHVYVIPPNYSMEFSGRRLTLSKRGAATRPMPVDEFFCSLAKELGSHAIGVVLSGSATDGTVGLRAIKAEGGVTFAQDEQSAKYSGMPHSAIAAGCVDFVLPPDRIAAELVQLGQHPYLAAASPLPIGSAGRVSFLQDVISMVRARTHCDFSGYKMSTVERRIQRRMALGKFDKIDKYLHHLRKNPDEVQALCRDMLIHVTEFFREPEVFESLKTQVMPRILAGQTGEDPLRVWVPGCSTGEEVYSVAIVLLEALRARHSRIALQIFGTDLSEEAVSVARNGSYQRAALAKVSADRLRRFFAKTEDGYQVNKAIRAMCIFARHDLTRDPPFSKLDLISCRNVLIYMDVELQDRVVSVLHYALKPNGRLLVGKSETLRGHSEQFTVEDRKHKIYVRRETTTPGTALRPRTEVLPAPFSDLRPPDDAASFDLLKAAERVIWERYVPATIVASSDLQILRFYGDTSPYLKPAAGVATLHLLKMVREELMMELRGLIHQAKKLDVARSLPIRVEANGRPRQVTLEVATIKGRSARGPDFVIVFRDVAASPASVASKGKSGDALARLRRELSSTRDYLRSVIDDLEVTNEELKVANEEVLSNNEELQTVNEELESSKEELQSSNEELTTLNDELMIRNTEIEEGREFANAIVETVREPLLVLERELRVIIANSAFYQTFKVKPEQTTNQRIFDLGDRQWDIPKLRQLLMDVAEKDASFADLEVDHEFPFIGWKRILLNARRVVRREDGAPRLILLAMEDVTQRKNAEEALQERESTLSTLLESASQAIVAVDPKGRMVLVNAMAERTSGYRRNELLQMHLSELTPPRFRKRISALLDRMFSDPSPRIIGVVGKLLGLRKTGEQFPVEATVSMTQTRGGPLAVILSTDITERKRAEDRLRASESALRHSHRLLRGLTARLLAAQEEERRRISRELHDNLNQQLAMLVVEVERLEKDVPPPGLLQKQLEMIRVRAASISDDVRRTAYQLHPSMLEHLGLVSALRSLCAGFKSQGSLNVAFKHRGVPKAISSDIALCLYRIAQEAIANVIKHSGAKEATLTLTGSKHSLQLIVKDEGVGFDVQSLGQSKGLGVESMNERVRLVGGTLSIHSKPGETRIEAEVPLAAPASRPENAHRV